MYYCQGCGAANGADAASCRICSHHLVRDRGGAPCHACGAPTVVGGAYCSLCGSAIAAAPQPSPVTVSGAAQADVVVANQGQSASVAPPASLNLGEGLDLPDWLKRAASEQPFDPGQQAAISARPFGPPAGSTATLARPAMGQPTIGEPATAAAVRAADSLEIPSRPPLSLPADGPGSSLPTWLQQPPVDDNESPHEPPVAHAFSSDVADTSSFISENDLPDWIRQLAAADEAKKAEEMRLAAEAARAGLQAADGDGRRRRLLPGETEDSGPTTNPWLVRRERADAADAVAADSWGSAIPAATVATPDHASANQKTEPSQLAPEESAATSAAMEYQPTAIADTPSARPNQLRLVLLVATVLILLALVAFAALS